MPPSSRGCSPAKRSVHPEAETDIVSVSGGEPIAHPDVFAVRNF